MFAKKHFSCIEPLEARIAPASAIASAKFIPALTGSPIVLHAGEVLTTGGVTDIPGVGKVGAGTYLLYVEKGDAIVFTQDRNNNSVVDFNEITGIAAGDGLRLTSFVDIYGDIVTNLKANLTLTDSDNNSGNDDAFLKGDGRVVLSNTIERLEFRSLTINDVLDENGDGDTTQEVATRLALTSYSIHGNVYAGKGFGIVEAGKAKAGSGLIIDDSGRAIQETVFDTVAGVDFYSEQRTPLKPTVGFIRTGSAVSGEWYSFGSSKGKDSSGYLSAFQSLPGEKGGDIAGINPRGVSFNISGLIAGDGGVGGAGGNLIDVTLNGDDAGGYVVKAGNGGRGPTGGVGGSIINFQDLNSVTGKIVIESGNGGAATTGAGGNGGQILLGALNVNGGVGIKLGNGGDGFTAGGNGATLSKAVITTPEGAVPFGANIISATHQGSINPVTRLLAADGKGVIGRHFGVDFNHDGFGDAVITSYAPNTVSVVFGDGFGGFQIGNALRIELDAPVNPEAVTVADFNQDGFLDIAVASSAGGNFSGISVFLALTEDANDDGTRTDAEDLNHNKVTDFVGFRTARQTFLPSLTNADPDSQAASAFYLFRRSAVPITDIEAGDFDGDGNTDIAVLATYVELGVQLRDFQVLMFLKPNIEFGHPTGEFFADVGTKAVGEPSTPARPLVPFISLGAGSKGVIQATSLRAGDTHDVVGATVVNSRTIRFYDNSASTTDTPLVSVAPILPVVVTQATGGQWGRVDTDRQLGPNHVNLTGQPPTVRDFAVVDSGGEQFTDTNKNGVRDVAEPFADANGNGIKDPAELFTDVNGNGVYDAVTEAYVDANNNGQFDAEQDGIADITLLTEDTPGFALSLLSGGLNTFFNISVSNNGKDNAGTFLGAQGFGFDADAMAIRDVDSNGDGLFNEVAVLSYISSRAPYYSVVQLKVANIPPADIVANPGAMVDVAFTSLVAGDPDTSIVAFDSYIPDLNFPTTLNYLTAIPTLVANRLHAVESLGDVIGSYTELSVRYLNLTSGSGGNGLVGGGGKAGSLGTGKIGDLSLTLPASLAFGGIVTLKAGDGGNGFSTGGSGGDISGVTLRGLTSNGNAGSFAAQLSAGNGGFGVGGNGGNGGGLSANSIERGIFFAAGNGGRGRFGGAGGDIIGNRAGGNFFDTRTLQESLTAGQGGNGIKGGGKGGSIVDFHGDFSTETIGLVAGELSYIAGNGGSAISGAGGAGGSIARSSPLTNEAHLGGDILLQAGDGGDGRSGGTGGLVSTFFFKPSDSDNPAILSILGGDGGHGISGPGGLGGDVTNINVPTVGKPNPFAGISPTPFTFDRILAGNGGASSGSVGGAGGSVSTVVSLNTDGPFVVSAGAGGDGLFRGGVGGSVSSTSLSTGGESFAKALIVAGAGGDASAFIPNNSDKTIVFNQAQKAFGGVIGRGGNGGTIKTFEQTGAIQARVDLIAGDGGNTKNYGTASDANVPVGIGGTITQIRIAGSIGNISSTVPIKSYNNVFNHESVADFLDRNLRNNLTPGQFADSDGVVGLVVGAAGRLKEVQNGFERVSTDPLIDGRAVFRSAPAFLGVNGSAIDITARNIMSIVAGSVERVAAIQVVSGIQITGNGVLGADKANLSTLEYLDKDGNPISEPFLDGKLIDGALIYKAFAPLSSIPGDRLPNSPRIFKLG